MATEIVRAVVRLRTLGPSGLNPPQIEVIDRLQTLSEDEESPLTDLDVDVWGPSIGITQTADQDPIGMRDTVGNSASCCISSVDCSSLMVASSTVAR